MTFEIVPSEDSKWAIVLDGFDTGLEAMKYCNELEEAIKTKQWLDAESKEADAIGKKYSKLLVDTDDTDAYNRLAELANLKGMSPKDVLDMIIENEMNDHVAPDMESEKMEVMC